MLMTCMTGQGLPEHLTSFEMLCWDVLCFGTLSCAVMFCIEACCETLLNACQEGMLLQQLV